MKQMVYVVRALIEEEFYCDSPEDFEDVKQEVRDTFKDFKIVDITMSDEPEERDLCV